MDNLDADRNVSSADNGVTNRDPPPTYKLFPLSPGHYSPRHEDRSRELLDAEELDAYNYATDREIPSTLELFPLTPGHFTPPREHRGVEELEHTDQAADDSPRTSRNTRDVESWPTTSTHYGAGHDWNFSGFTGRDYGTALQLYDAPSHDYHKKKKAKTTQKPLDPATKKAWGATLSLGLPDLIASIDPRTRKEWGATLSLGLPDPTAPVDPRINEGAPAEGARINEEAPPADDQGETELARIFNEEAPEEVGETEAVRRRLILRKALCTTDANPRHNRLLVYKDLKESWGVPDPATLESRHACLRMVDEMDGSHMDFKLTYWPLSNNYALKDFGEYVRKHHLQKGDIVVISMDEALGELFITFERQQP